MNLEPLKFDTMEVNTSLAKFFEDHPNLVEEPTKTDIKKDTYLRGAIEDLPDKFKKLANLIEKNIDLFCQLEYFIRKFPVKTTKNNDLKLLVNYLNYHSLCNEPVMVENIIKTPSITISDTTPLVNLGLLADVFLAEFKEAILISTTRNVAVCTLFKELCEEAGLSVLLKIGSPHSGNLFHFEKDCGSCVGIITRRSDIESAVDVFLNAPIMNIWAVKMIYVEESAIERFKQSIGSKAIHKIERISQFCTDTYHYNDKVYLFEFIEDTAAQPSSSTMYIPIQTYRTVKELLSLINTSLCVSLWSSDVAESNEIANSLKSSIVWINDYGNFKGSPRIAQSYFSHLNLDNNQIKTKLTPKIEHLMKLRSEWVKKDIFVRRELVLGSLKGKKITMNFDMDFVDVGKDFMCVGKVMPVEIVYLEDISLQEVLRAISRGSGVLYYSKGGIDEYYSYLTKIKAPIMFLENELSPLCDGEVSVYKIPLGWTKTIWTSFGTIFAN
ncbi:uncharacterized protein LOC110994843 isoform X2 [Pieris rapae]|uniref:uncharacterized protein LOC110994843 isoform X2 n=1 Tax=Pieris rapae TaxID=64459 RepID=UPI001E27BD07|nr:uncharacterized protein LOC110994843 isoform X2 [Pieris rapae]